MYKKIDIYLYNKTLNIWEYECSTNWAKTCKEAKERFLRIHNYLDNSQVKCNFTK